VHGNRCSDLEICPRPFKIENGLTMVKTYGVRGTS
jgi:hypothetical protein